MQPIIAQSKHESVLPQLPAVDLKQLPAKLSKRLWVSPCEFVSLTHALGLAEWALNVRQWGRERLADPSRRGPKVVYRDSSIVVMALIQVAWQMSYEEVVDYLRGQSETAQVVGLPAGRVICASQYWQRRRALGVLPFWLFFVALVWQLVRMGVIVGKDVILDATTQRVWFHTDEQAGWSFPKPGKGSVWGYKVHTLLCRCSALPVMFLLTPANRQESLLAIPLLVLAVVCYGFAFTIVRADAGYFTYPILNFIRTVLHASFMVDYNLRRRRKRFLATRFFADQWRFHLRPRATIERHFAWAKRYFGLESAHWAGLVAAYQHTALVYATMLAVALIAHRYQRPELAGSRTNVLALKTLA
jgi:hypothetical protein